MNTTSQKTPFKSAQLSAEMLLRDLGYEVCGDDEDGGWYWTLGDFASRAVTLPFDTIDECTAAALSDLVARTGELLGAATAVLANWERGDLAQAVRELDACVGAFHRPEPRTGASDRRAALARRSHEGREAWLVAGDGRDEPWLDAVYLDRQAALDQCLAIGTEWRSEGLDVDLVQLSRDVLAGHAYVPRDGLSVGLTPIVVVG